MSPSYLCIVTLKETGALSLTTSSEDTGAYARAPVTRQYGGSSRFWIEGCVSNVTEQFGKLLKSGPVRPVAHPSGCHNQRSILSLKRRLVRTLVPSESRRRYSRFGKLSSSQIREACTIAERCTRMK